MAWTKASVPCDLTCKARYSQGYARVVLRAQKVKGSKLRLESFDGLQCPIYRTLLMSATMGDWKLGVIAKWITERSVCRGADVKQKLHELTQVGKVALMRYF